MLFKDGSREPLHGHNYRVQIKGNALELNDDMVFDFLDIKPIVKAICDSLDHKLLIPRDNAFLRIETQEKNYLFTTKDESVFSIPQTDALILPIENTSAERLAGYLAGQIKQKVLETFQFEFSELEVEVEETPNPFAALSALKDLKR